MKINPAVSVALILISITCLGTAAFGQSRIAMASVPFEFQVGKTILPAGKYFFERLYSTSDTSMLIIRDSGYKPIASTFLSFDHLSGRELSDEPSILFADLGNTKMLAYLLDPGAGYLGRAGASKWRRKKGRFLEGSRATISLKPLEIHN